MMRYSVSLEGKVPRVLEKRVPIENDFEFLLDEISAGVARHVTGGENLNLLLRVFLFRHVVFHIHFPVDQSLLGQRVPRVPQSVTGLLKTAKGNTSVL